MNKDFFNFESNNFKEKVKEFSLEQKIKKPNSVFLFYI